MIGATMRQALLLCLLCLVAALGVAGTHAHLAGDDHHHHDHAYTVSLIDADHAADHVDDGDIDIDPLVKAFGTLSLVATFVAIAVFCCFIELIRLGGFVLRLPTPPPLRPPRDGLRFHLLPPSRGPPTRLV